MASYVRYLSLCLLLQSAVYLAAPATARVLMHNPHSNAQAALVESTSSKPPRPSPYGVGLPREQTKGILCNLDSQADADLSLLAISTERDSLFHRLKASEGSITIPPGAPDCTEVARKGDTTVAVCNESNKPYIIKRSMLAKYANDIATVCGRASTNQYGEQHFPDGSTIGNGRKFLNGRLYGHLSVLVRGKQPSPQHSDEHFRNKLRSAVL